MSKETPEAANQEIIDTTGMSEGKKKALELAEASREGHWEYPTFAGALFMGQLPWSLIYPYPELPDDRDERGEAFLSDLKAYLRDHVDVTQWVIDFVSRYDPQHNRPSTP